MIIIILIIVIDVITFIIVRIVILNLIFVYFSSDKTWIFFLATSLLGVTAHKTEVTQIFKSQLIIPQILLPNLLPSSFLSHLTQMLFIAYNRETNSSTIIIEWMSQLSKQTVNGVYGAAL